MDKLVLKDIGKTIRKNTILKDISLEIEPGVLGIIGQNGAGKSTLLKIICGLFKSTSGNVTLNDIPITEQPNQVMDKLGFFIEEPVLYPYFTAGQQLEHCMALRDFSDESYAKQIIEILDIESFIDKKISKYSSGMKQRLGIACAVIHNPSIIVLDEPTNSLDITAIRQIRELIKSMRDDGKTIIITSHILTEIEDVCDQVVMMDNGAIIDKFSLDTINKHYEDIYEIRLEKKKEIIEFLNDYYDSNAFKIYENHIILEMGENKLSCELKYILEKGFQIMGVQKEGKQLEEYYIRKVEEG